MNAATHAALAKAVVEALGWPGDRNLVARNAIWPDAARVIEVDKYGAYVLGHSLSSLTHFCHPVGGGKFEGYCWMLDPSVPGIDLSTVKVIPKPECWGFPIVGNKDLLESEPFAKLVRDLTGHASIQADEIVYTASSIMAEWAYNGFVLLAKKLTGDARRQALDILAGMLFHLAAQDPAVPAHVVAVMLDGHAAFEGDVDEEYKRMEGSGEIAALLKSLIAADNAPDGLLPRKIAEDTATSAIVSPRKLRWYRCMWRPGWNRLVRQCVLRGLVSSVQVGKVLLKAVDA